MIQHFLALLRLFGAPRTAPRRRNLGCIPPRGLILSQWSLPDYRVGLGRFGRVGCEICAVHNVLLRCGKAVPLWEIIDSFTARRSLMLLGLGGTDPFTIGPWLAERGVGTRCYGRCRRHTRPSRSAAAGPAMHSAPPPGRTGSISCPTGPAPGTSTPWPSPSAAAWWRCGTPASRDGGGPWRTSCPTCAAGLSWATSSQGQFCEIAVFSHTISAKVTNFWGKIT